MAGEARRRRLRALLDLAGVSYEALDGVDQAFVHESAAKEESLISNERLEFLGDAILGLVTARWLYATYPDEREGILAKRKAAIVSDSAIADTARNLGFADLLRVGAGVRAEAGATRTSLLADAFEAFVATLFLHYGTESAQRFIEREHIAKQNHEAAIRADAKTRLQELVQARLASMPVYSEQSEGPPHRRTFTSVVRVNDEPLGSGSGSSKKAAQQVAAAQALATLQSRFS